MQHHHQWSRLADEAGWDVELVVAASRLIGEGQLFKPCARWQDGCVSTGWRGPPVEPRKYSRAFRAGAAVSRSVKRRCPAPFRCRRWRDHIDELPRFGRRWLWLRVRIRRGSSWRTRNCSSQQGHRLIQSSFGRETGRLGHGGLRKRFHQANSFVFEMNKARLSPGREEGCRIVSAKIGVQCMRSASAALTAELACSAPRTWMDPMVSRASSGDTSAAIVASPRTWMVSISPDARTRSRSCRL